MASRGRDDAPPAATDTLLARVRAQCEGIPVWRWYDMTVQEAEEGRCRVKLRVQPGMINADDDTLNGGIIAALVDESVGAALMTVYELGKDVQGRTTTELNVSYLEGARTPEVYAEARILRKGRTLVVGTADVLDASGKRCATGRVTYMVFR
ncbi:MAG: PaaI family thioesterase [Chloroflexi bacterium]|nr:PaaI family thioesterase [Chloroflexota bacterium]